MDTQWILPDNSPSQVDVFARELTISPALARVLINRNIEIFTFKIAFGMLATAVGAFLIFY